MNLLKVAGNDKNLVNAFDQFCDETGRDDNEKTFYAAYIGKVADTQEAISIIINQLGLSCSRSLLKWFKTSELLEYFKQDYGLYVIDNYIFTDDF